MHTHVFGGCHVPQLWHVQKTVSGLTPHGSDTAHTSTPHTPHPCTHVDGDDHANAHKSFPKPLLPFLLLPTTLLYQPPQQIPQPAMPPAVNTQVLLYSVCSFTGSPRFAQFNSMFLQHLLVMWMHKAPCSVRSHKRLHLL